MTNEWLWSDMMNEEVQMRNRWIALVLVIVAFVGVGAFFASQNDDDGWGPWDNDHEIVRTIDNPDGTTSTVIVERDRGFPGFFFFPFGFFLFWVVIFFVVRPLFWRGGPPGGDRMRDRFAEWHRQEHERMDAANHTGA
jgi:hypothetical protein